MTELDSAIGAIRVRSPSFVISTAQKVDSLVGGLSSHKQRFRSSGQRSWLYVRHLPILTVRLSAQAKTVSRPPLCLERLGT